MLLVGGVVDGWSMRFIDSSEAKYLFPFGFDWDFIWTWPGACQQAFFWDTLYILTFIWTWNLDSGLTIYFSFPGVPFWIARTTRNVDLEDVRRGCTSNVTVGSGIRSPSWH